VEDNARSEIYMTHRHCFSEKNNLSPNVIIDDWSIGVLLDVSLKKCGKRTREKFVLYFVFVYQLECSKTANISSKCLDLSEITRLCHIWRLLNELTKGQGQHLLKTTTQIALQTAVVVDMAEVEHTQGNVHTVITNDTKLIRIQMN